MGRRKPYDFSGFQQALHAALQGKTPPKAGTYNVIVEIIAPGGNRLAAGVIGAGSRLDADAAFEKAVTPEQTGFDIEG